jgi:hypothetical protein
MDIWRNKLIYADKVGSELILWDGEGKKYSYDFKDSQFYSYNIGKKRRIVKSINRFLTHTSIHDIKWQNEDYRKFINWIDRKEKRCSNVGTFIGRLKNYLHLEGYFLLNLKISDLNRIHEPPAFYNKKVLKMFVKHDIRISWRIESGFKNYYDFLTDVFFCLDSLYDETRESRFFGEDLRFIVYNASALQELIKYYRYDMKHLFQYLCFVSDYEALSLSESIRLLKDYAQMMNTMQDKYVKYPRNLHTTHDIVIKNFNNAKKEYNKELFQGAIKEQYKYEWRQKEHIILVPDSTEAVQDEGCNLRHCVGGYINSIIERRTNILFLRAIDAWNESLITLEVRDDKLVEARGFANRFPSKSEKDLLKKWCKNKNIEYMVRK